MSHLSAALWGAGTAVAAAYPFLVILRCLRVGWRFDDPEFNAGDDEINRGSCE